MLHLHVVHGFPKIVSPSWPWANETRGQWRPREYPPLVPPRSLGKTVGVNIVEPNEPRKNRQYGIVPVFELEKGHIHILIPAVGSGR